MRPISSERAIRIEWFIMYGVWQKKKLYGKEFLGVVRTTILIDPTGKVVHVWSPVRVQGHAQTVKTALKDML